MNKRQQPTGRNWYSVKALAPGHAEIVIYDEIGYWGKSASDFITELNAMKDVAQIDVRINSPGGDVFDGHAIYNLLRSHPAHVTAYIDGIAASIASIIMLAADEIIMPANALVMIHDPVVGAYGDVEALRKAADVLEKLRGILLSAYVARTGEDEATVSAWMTKETWFTAEEAIASGLADTLLEPVKAAAVFDARKFSNAPRAALQNLMAPVNSVKKKIGENAMTIEELKAQLQAAGDKKTALEAKLNTTSADLATTTASLADAQAKLTDAADMIAAGKAYKAKLVDQVVQARRTLKMLGDTDEDVKAASEFVASWPLAHIEAEAKQFGTLSENPNASAITPGATDEEDKGDQPMSFRNQKEA